jgi:hypothetical protein
MGTSFPSTKATHKMVGGLQRTGNPTSSGMASWDLVLPEHILPCWNLIFEIMTQKLHWILDIFLKSEEQVRSRDHRTTMASDPQHGGNCAVYPVFRDGPQNKSIAQASTETTTFLNNSAPRPVSLQPQKEAWLQ